MGRVEVMQGVENAGEGREDRRAEEVGISDLRFNLSDGCGWVTWLLLVCGGLAAAALGGPLATRETANYVLHTDLPEHEAREAALRLDRAFELYLQRTEEFSGKIEGRLPVHLYADADAYERAGGAKGSAGLFDG